MYTVIEAGSKQHKVQEGDKLRVRRFDAQVGNTVTFDKTPFLSGDDIKVGHPYVEGAKAEAKILEQDKAKKIVVYKFKARRDYRNKRGHRQPYTSTEIGTII